MNKAREAAIQGAVLRTYDSWTKLKPKKSQEVIQKNTPGKEIQIHRVTDTAFATIKVTISYIDGRTEVTFCNDPLGYRYVAIRMGDHNKVFINHRIDVPKNIRKDTVITAIKEKLSEGFAKYQQDVNLFHLL